MKKKFLLLSILFVGVGLIIASCVKDERNHKDDQAETGESTELAIRSAREFFENTASDLTLPGEGIIGADGAVTKSATDGPMLIPQWDKAFRHDDYDSDVLEIPLQFESTLQASVMRMRSGQGANHKMEDVYSRLVFARNPQNDSMVYYVTTFIAEKRFSGDRTKHISQIASLPKSGKYSGLIVYSTVDGKLLGGRKYLNGKAINRLRPHDHGQEEASAHGHDNHEGNSIGTRDLNHECYEYVSVLFAVVPELTRSGGSEILCARCGGWHPDVGFCLVIDPLEITDEKPDPGDPGPPPSGNGEGSGSSPGGDGDGAGNPGSDPGSSNGGGSSGGATNQPQQIECGQQAAANMLSTGHNWNLFMAQGLNSIFLEPYRSASVEYTVTLNQLRNGGYEITDPYTENHPNQVSQSTTWGTSINSIAYIHNHPNNSLPSCRDIANLAIANSVSNGVFTTSYIVCANGDTFAIQVENEAVAANFANRYYGNNAMQNSFMSELLNQAGLFVGQGMSSSEAHIYAMAYLLNVENSGIKLLVLENGRFIQKDASQGILSITMTTCK